MVKSALKWTLDNWRGVFDRVFPAGDLASGDGAFAFPLSTRMYLYFSVLSYNGCRP